MYQQPNYSYHSNDSVHRLSSNNPFRMNSQSSGGGGGGFNDNLSMTSKKSQLVRSPQLTSFDEWVKKNKKLIDQDETFDDSYDNYLLVDEQSRNKRVDLGGSTGSDYYAKPVLPPSRTGSNGSTTSQRKMSSNNPFASSLSSRETSDHKSRTPPARPPKANNLPPPPYEEAAGKEAALKDYPREKSGSSSHRSHSDPSRTHRSRRKSHSDKDRRHKSSSKTSPSKKHPEPVKAKNLDTIDRLDVTAFFGGGFHHDGPFDACTPHRNKNSKVAPVMAFPADGPNTSIKGGQRNVNTDEQMNLAFGNYYENNYGHGAKLAKSDDNLPILKTNKRSPDPITTYYTQKENPSVINFDANVKSEPIHGPSTAGLGSSTFLDGAPAPKGDDYLSPTNGGGLSRKKSLAQRLRKNSGSESNTRRSSNDSTPNHLDGVHTNLSGSSESEEPVSLIRRVKSLKVGRRER